VDILTFLFVPPLPPPLVQVRSSHGRNIRDAIFTNRIDYTSYWRQLRLEHDARLIPFEFKNYDKTAVGPAEVRQLERYLGPATGRLGVLCCRTLPSAKGYDEQLAVYRSESKTILFLTDDDLRKLLLMDHNSDDPAQHLVELRDALLLRFER
jgi:phosphomevalonate kinase